MRNLILATLTKKAAEIKVHKKSSPEKEIRIPFAVKKFNLEMTNIRVSWKLILHNLIFAILTNKAAEIKVHKKSSLEKMMRI